MEPCELRCGEDGVTFWPCPLCWDAAEVFYIRWMFGGLPRWEDES